MSASDPPTVSYDAELAQEQRYLTAARASLARMRESAMALDPTRASDGDSSYDLAVTLARRIATLQDDPRTTLFFGRLDHTGGEPYYIGRRHVSDAGGDPVVLDWRAPVSAAFYRASRTEPMGMLRRRRFGVDHGRLTAIEDEDLTGTDDRPDTPRSGILADEIERPRTGPMRDIVSTIQPEQDLIVRADVGTTVCVQGAPGTGKTAVGLHRAAWLLYAHRERLDRTGVLVVGPNRAFLDHISAVLPALGEIRVHHATAADLVSDKPARADETADLAVLKGDSRMAAVMHRAVWAHVQRATEPLVVPRGVRKWRIPAYEVQEILDELSTRGVRYDAARAMLPQRLAHAVLLRMERSGDSPDDRVQDAIARSAPVRKYVASVWPTIDATAVLFALWSSPELLAAAAADELTSDEQAMLLWDKPFRSKGSARWSAADLVLLDEIGDQLSRVPSLGHVMLDEAQDLSQMQLRSVGRRCSTGSATVLGDIAQGTTPWATDSWATTMQHLGKPEHHLEVLDRGFRVPASVIDFAARLLPAMAPGLGAPVSVRENPGRLDLLQVEGPDAVADAVRDQIGAARGEQGSIGVILPDARVAQLSRALSAAGIEHGRLDQNHGDDSDHQVQLVPATVAKGLEFDHVIVVEPAAIAAAEPDRRTGLRRLYVVLTRAVSSLAVVHAEALPVELGG
ncbi:HelD family protein [Rudaeicoccus suwonensis]|uniref:DNA helicase IV n=1 Tax=Rudaeicoccus suwonensis TaxID=657409 RepID=A0A561E7Y2_9MICO|nr:AAA family ATPase [Rudaeicoccus suwonensis]TWE11680.1 DNA helicase IV [Rudaeicoccus suwonensis]